MQLIGDRDFGLVFWGKLVALTGVWAQTIVVVILTYRATGSAAWVGAVGAAQIGPQLGLAMVGGRLSDAYGPVRQIVTGGLLSAGGCLGLAAWLQVSSGGRASVTVALIAASTVCGTGLALLAPALQAVVPMLVRTDELSAAVALNFVPTALARTFGPAGGAMLLAAFSPAISLFVIGLVLLVVTGAFLRIRRERVRRPAGGEDRRIRDALRYVWRDRTQFALLLAVAAVGAGSEPAITLAPALARRLASGGAGEGWVTATFGLGGLLGVIAHRYVGRALSAAREGCAALSGLGLTMAVAGLGGSFVLVLPALVLAGASMVVAITAFSVAIQQRCPAAMLGRVMALWVIAFSGVRPVAGPALGLVADTFSLATAFAAAGLLTLAAAVVVLAVVAPVPRRSLTRV